ncbi:hypothetical protein M3Y99_01479600 [Aphelenchoides fujianensis]|nr:hypothetical protein M3Y99_01479600 [Aphelenchoides fujianensis]
MCPPAVYEPYVVQAPEGHLLAGTPHRATYNGSFACYVRELSGTLGPTTRSVAYSGPWQAMPTNKRLFVNRDQFAIKCVDAENRTLFRDVYTTIAPKPRLNPPPVRSAAQLNVAILMLDSVSRTQFFRHMPFAMKVMRRLDFQFLTGYTKIADDMETNLLAMLAGKVHDPDRNDLTALLRDEMILKEVEEGGDLPYYEYLYTYQNAERMCANGEFLTPRFLHIWERFSTKYADKCHLSFNSIAALTRKNPNHLELLDQPLADALDRLEDAGALEHTMLHEIASTYVGRVEERMPLMAVFVPPKFRRAEAKKFANLRANANRLTSAFDVHQTLQEAMDARIPAQHCMCMKPLDVAVLNETQKFQARALMRTQIHAAVHELPCVFSYELDDPRSFTPFTISPVARQWRVTYYVKMAGQCGKCANDCGQAREALRYTCPFKNSTRTLYNGVWYCYTKFPVTSPNVQYISQNYCGSVAGRFDAREDSKTMTPLHMDVLMCRTVAVLTA